MGVVSGFSIFFGVMVRPPLLHPRAAIDASRLQGLRGIREHDPKKLWFFYLWKLGRFCFESMLLLTDMFEAPRLLAVPAPTVVKWLELTPPPRLCSRFVAFVLLVVVTAVRGYCVW